MKNEELKLQAQCFQWHWNTFPQERGLLHANNNNSQNAIKGMMNRSIGVVPGVADTEYAAPAGLTVYMEFKTPTGVQSEAQKDFQRKVEARGHKYYIIRSFEQFQQIIYHYQIYGELEKA